MTSTGASTESFSEVPDVAHRPHEAGVVTLPVFDVDRAQAPHVIWPPEGLFSPRFA
jgi:hypothetical protein